MDELLILVTSLNHCDLKTGLLLWYDWKWIHVNVLIDKDNMGMGLSVLWVWTQTHTKQCWLFFPFRCC